MLPVEGPAIDAAPKPVTTLSPDEWLVIESDAELIVLQSPGGVVAIEHDADARPIRVRGKFAGGSGGTESRTFTRKHLYFVEAAKPGTTDLIVIPIGVQSESEIVRHVVTVGGTGPRPPPGPHPKPDPKPKPKAVVLAVVEDVQNRSPQTAICLNAIAGWNELKEQGHDWRLYDDQTSEVGGTAAMSAVRAAGVSLPAVVVYDRATQTVIAVRQLPADITGVKALVSEVVE